MDSDHIQVHPSIQEPALITDESTKLRFLRSSYNLAHLSSNKMAATISQYVRWQGMDANIKKYFEQCHVCSLWSKTTGENPYPVISESSATVRFDIVQIDILEFPTVSDIHCLQYSNALSIIDMATGYPIVIP